MTAMELRPEDTYPAITVLVVDKDEDIRTALGDLLEDAGYAVIEAENLQEAESLIDAALEPMVLIVGDAEVGASSELEFFTAVAANPVTNHAYIYLTTTPERWRLPALVKVLTNLETPIVEKPYELVSLLAVVAAAATRVRSYIARGD
jgi:DNA-binding NtrC family response regulator